MKCFFKILVKINNWVLPSLYKKDPAKLKTWQKGILAYRYYILLKALD